jgi:type VII secretion integral membrane protein EccD
MRGMSEHVPEPAVSGQGGLNAGSVPLAQTGVAEQVQAQQRAAPQPERPPALVDDLCRLTVCGPDRSVELAVPVHVPLIDLLPALVGHLGEGLADAGLEHGGWVLQRLGDPPLREELSVAVLGLHDGDVVHLRPRADQLPPLDFDDLIDGIAVGISGRPDRWRPEMSRRLLTGLLALPLAAALAVLTGHVSVLSVTLAATLAVVLLALAAGASRALADLPVASVLGAAAIGYAGVAAGELPLLHGGPGGRELASATTLWPALLAAGVGMAGAAALLSVLLGREHPALAGLLAVALLAGAAGALATFGRLHPVPVAGVLVGLVMLLGNGIPLTSFRLARMRLEPPPATPEELQENLDPVPGQHVLDRTRWADQYMAALYGGCGIVLTACLAVLGTAVGWPARAVAMDAIVLLQSREHVGARHRLACVVPAVTGALVLAIAAGLRSGPRGWPPFVAGLLVVAGLLMVGEQALPGRKLLPHWGRAGDLLHTLAAAALIPAVIWLTGLYEYARTIHV